MLTNKDESIGLRHCDDPTDMVDIYKNIDEQNPNKKHKILIGFNDMTANMLSHKKTSASSNRTINQSKANKQFLCLYHTILFRSTKRYYIKL